MSRKRDLAILSSLAIPLAGLDTLLNLLSPPATGWAGPHGGLILQLAVDLALPLLLWFPRAVAVFALFVTTVLTVSDAYSPGLLVSEHAVTLLTMPMAVPLIIGRLVTLPNRRVGMGLIGAFVVVGARLWAPSWSITPSALLGTVVPALLTLYFDARRRLLCSLRERVDRAERERDLLAERAVFEERHRLAAEMHDVVTHRLSLMVLHAGALGVASADGTVQRAAEDIRSAGVQALDELRDLLGVLRGTQQAEPAPESTTALDPAVLAAESESVGVPVDLQVDGTPGQVSPAVARTAYRVVQEALTNIRKHAPGTAVSVRVAYQPAGVRVRVTNTAPAATPDPVLAASGGGAGLTGLRHRVEVIGGTLSAGPTDGGGWAITAILPVLVPTESAGHDSVGGRR